MVPAGEILCFHRAVINPKVLDCQPTASAFLCHIPQLHFVLEFLPAPICILLLSVAAAHVLPLLRASSCLFPLPAPALASLWQRQL